MYIRISQEYVLLVRPGGFSGSCMNKHCNGSILIHNLQHQYHLMATDDFDFGNCLDDAHP